MRNQRPCKQSDRSLFLALQADAKEFPGGIRALAEIIGINGNTLSNCLNPDHDAQPPSFSVVIEIIKVAQAKRAMFSMAQLVGQVPMDFDLENKSPSESIGLFLSLMHSVGEVLDKGSDAAKDGRFDAEERQMLEPLLFGLMKAAGELIHSIRG